MYSDREMKAALEAMMFVQGDLLAAGDAAEVLEINTGEAIRLFRELAEEYEQEGRGIIVREVNASFQFVTRAKEEGFIKKLCTPLKIRRLSQAALEVIAIVAYRQPVTRGEIDSVRGIKCGRVLDGLIEKGLVRETGRSEGVGRATLYGTTDEFLKKFGFQTIEDLPDIEDPTSNDEDCESIKSYEQININFSEDER